ncbi:galactose mutarotase-like protein [Violaceomyces palustris]|uniref:Galactose mutarotase-like protein n=1 Tax=Violaceomyces palustris TaxID=1673888 RepID=A0ACD0P6J7_9BASI|nr:galactose mutarotase-like protein [Violaceomyces palustris]
MPATLINNNSTVRLELPKSKASAEVRLYGATVTSWKSNGGQEKLFLSSKAALDGSSAIRGGIPIVFPVFGSPSDHKDAPLEVSRLPKHGFARTENWSISNRLSPVDEEGQVSVTLELSTTTRPNLKAVWDYDLHLEYTVTLTPSTLKCRLTVAHLATSPNSPMPFQALLHNYLAVPDSTKAGISDLSGSFYLDKNAGGEEGEELSQEIKLQGEPCDRVYVGKVKDSADGLSDGGRDITLKYNASLLDDPLRRMGKGVELSRSKELRDTVIWNPGQEAGDAIADLHEGGWKEYVCVEPGSVAGFEKLESGQTWQAEQTLTAW